MIMDIDIYTKYIHQVLYERTRIMLVSLLYYGGCLVSPILWGVFGF
jgi:hypothetical protein